MKLLLPISVIASAVAGYLACAVTGARSDGGAPQGTVAQSGDAQLRTASQPLMDNMIDALQKKDFKLYLRDVQPELHSATSEGVFKNQIDLLSSDKGKVQKPHWLGAYRKGSTVVTIWKAKSGKGEDDILISMPLLMMDNYIRIITFDLQ